MKTKKNFNLLSIIKNNGTGIIEGHYRASILSNKAIPPRDLDNLSQLVKGNVKIHFSFNEYFIGEYLLLIKDIERGKGEMFCTLLKSNGTEYKYLDDCIKITLKPFSGENDTVGKFLAVLPF